MTTYILMTLSIVGIAVATEILRHTSFEGTTKIYAVAVPISLLTGTYWWGESGGISATGWLIAAMVLIGVILGFALPDTIRFDTHARWLFRISFATSLIGGFVLQVLKAFEEWFYGSDPIPRIIWVPMLALCIIAVILIAWVWRQQKGKQSRPATSGTTTATS